VFSSHIPEHNYRIYLLITI